MYEYELHQARSAELRRRAADERLARTVARGARAARRAAEERASGGAESESHTHRLRRLRFPRTA
ncbi:MULTISPECIES: hypothetical protein [unclassified Streptomyces]|uniref:hypothetical protein n=1 Tax=unclassified Streptomyces TaxID=2593676 RepID=UPI0029BA6661|nr:hypothetical protein [Streptomyces sp. FL07-04A]MDX3576894.1 hypothetical protein [Streptomyces sp. FL07-04A]